MKCVFLDCAIVNPGDIPWTELEELTEFRWYERTSKDQLADRLRGVEAVIVDSMPVGGDIMRACPDLKFIGIAATGFDHIDLKTAEELGIAVANVPSYAADAVAQHAIALLLSITDRIQVYNDAVAAGEWGRSRDYTFIKAPVTLLSGKSIGIIGYGAIGKRVGEIAEALGMTVNVYSRDPQAAVSSDVVSLNCPLTAENEKMIDREFISRMKDGAILINTARGKLVDEEALAEALKSGKLSGAGLDVLAKEPPDDDDPLIGLENCFITPHIGFIPIEARKTVVDTCAANIRSFLSGGRLNRIV